MKFIVLKVEFQLFGNIFHLNSMLHKLQAQSKCKKQNRKKYIFFCLAHTVPLKSIKRLQFVWHF